MDAKAGKHSNAPQASRKMSAGVSFGAGAVLVTLLALLGLWLRGSHSHSSHSTATVAQPPMLPASPGEERAQSSGDGVSTLQDAQVSARRQVAQRVCDNPVLSQFSDPARGCHEQLRELHESLEDRMRQYSAGGVVLDPKHCKARSPDGTVSDSESTVSELLGIAKVVLVDWVSFDFDRDLSPHALNRLRLVALCNLQKTTNYWLEHPERMPESSEIEEWLLFDHEKQQPTSSRWVGYFLRALAKLHAGGV